LPRHRRVGREPRKVDVRLPGKGDSNTLGARPVHLIITMIKWFRTSRMSIKNSLSCPPPLWCEPEHKKPVKARFWPWLEPFSVRKSLKPCKLFPPGQARNVQRFRGGLVFKAHRLCVSLNSRLESNKEEREGLAPSLSERRGNNLTGFKDVYLKAKARIWP